MDKYIRLWLIKSWTELSTRSQFLKRWIVLYPLDSAVGVLNTYLLDSDLARG